MAKGFVDLLDFQYSADEPFKNAVREHVQKIDDRPTGKALLQRIVQKASGRISDTKLDVRQVAGTCAFRDGGVFYFDPTYLLKEPFFDPTQKAVIQSNKAYVYVFHELVHFLHYLEQEELRTVRLYDTANDQFSENKFRRELNLPRRPCYCWRKTPQNSQMYDFEQRKRQDLKLPDQSLLGPQSAECTFSATN